MTNTIRLGHTAKLKRDTRVGQVIGLRRLGRVLYAEIEWAPGWSTSAPTSAVEAARVARG